MPRRSPALCLTCALAVLLLVVLTAAACGGSDSAMATGGTDAAAPDSVVPVVDSGLPAPLCVDGRPTGAWPAGPYAIALTGTLPPDLQWDGVGGPVRLADYFEPCAARSRLLVIRSTAAWCGTCGWHATHTTRLMGDARFAGRLRLLDLLVADEDNIPATTAAAARFRSRIDIPPSLDARIAVDAKYMFSPVLPSNNALPEYVLVDTRTMQVLNVQANPPPERLITFFDFELAQLDGLPRTPLVAPALYDGLLTEDEQDLLHDMTLPGAPPPDPTNAVADLPAAAAFGQTLFADASLSPTGTISCAHCHDATKAFADGLDVAQGVQAGDRNSPSIALAAHARWQFWDGRADTLWMQALAPFENPKELDSSRLFVAHAVVDRHATDYTALFGTTYPLPDLSALPSAGKPGDPSYDALPAATRDAVTRVFVNVAKSIAAYERTLRIAPTAFDRYVQGDLTALAAPERESLRQFFEVGCVQCHHGPRLTDDAFHAIGFPTGRLDGAADRGRADVLLGLATSEFVASGRWSDSPMNGKPLVFTTVPDAMVGAFKTPSLRGVASTAPYGHGGAYPQLTEVAVHYGTRGSEVPRAKTAGTVEVWVPHFDNQVQSELPALLQLLTAP